MNESVLALAAALEAKKEGDLNAAKVLLTRILPRLPKDIPEYPVALSELAELEESCEDWVGAIRHLLNLLIDLETRVGERDPVTIAVMDKAANLFERLGRTDESIALYERARSLSERSLWADQAGATAEGGPKADPLKLKSAQPPKPTAPHSQPKRATAPIDPNFSSAMLQAFEKSYSPYLKHADYKQDEFEDISLDDLDRKLHLPDRLKKLRKIEDREEEDDETPAQALMRKIAFLVLRAILPVMNECTKFAEENGVLIAIMTLAPIILLTGSTVTSQNAPPDKKFFQQVTHQYTSADGQKYFALASGQMCELLADAVSIQLPYQVYSQETANLRTLIFGSVLEKQIWFYRQYGSFRDDDGGVLYADLSPQTASIQVTDIIDRAVTYSYLKKLQYPKDLNELNDALEENEGGSVPFRNSWTGKQYTPTFISISHNFTSELKGDAWRAETLFRFDIGAPIEDEPSFKPGEIRCYQCAISIPRGVINEFFVRIADMDGTLIKGNQRGRYYFRGWEDGHKLKPQPVRPYTEGFSLRPRIVWIIPSNMNQTLAWLIHYGGSLTFFGQAGLCLILATLVRKKRLLRAFMYTASAVACLIAIAYVVSPMMP